MTNVNLRPAETISDFFNINHIDTVSEQLLKIGKNKDITGEPIFTDKRTVTFNNGSVIVKYEEGFFSVYGKIKTFLNLNIGDTYTPFMLYTIVFHHGNISKALKYIEIKYIEQRNPFFKVGDSWYQEIYGNKIIRRSIASIKEDISIEIIKAAPKFNAFNYEPNHMDFKKYLPDGSYNLYREVKHIPYPGEWPTIKKLLKHAFGDQFNIIVRYIQQLYLHPKRKLPILVLGSEEKETGKSTFAQILLTEIFTPENCVKETLPGISGRFNGHFTESLIVWVEEAKSDKRELTEILKDLSTTDYVRVEKKGIEPYQQPFHAKFVMLTNHIEDFLMLDRNEDRYWVKKVPVLDKKINPEKLKKLIIKEIPALLYSLIAEIPDLPQEGRMYFKKEEYQNKDLEAAIEGSIDPVALEVREKIDTILKYYNIKEIKLNLHDIKEIVFPNDSKMKISYIKKALNDALNMKLPDIKEKYFRINAYSLRTYANDIDFLRETIGRVYTFKNDSYNSDGINSIENINIDNIKTLEEAKNIIANLIIERAKSCETDPF
jgi:hypothetical protein